MARADKLLAQSLKIVGLAIVGDPQVLVAVRHWHMSGRRKIDNAQTVGTKAYGTKRDHPRVVGTTVCLKLAHRSDDAHMIFLAALPLQTDQSGYGTHKD
jgi:hypothetical protein